MWKVNREEWMHMKNARHYKTITNISSIYSIVYYVFIVDTKWKLKNFYIQGLARDSTKIRKIEDFTEIKQNKQ